MEEKGGGGFIEGGRRMGDSTRRLRGYAAAANRRTLASCSSYVDDD